MAPPSSQSLIGHAFHVHRFVTRNLVAGLLRRGCGAAPTAVAAATSPPSPVRQLSKNALLVDVDTLLLEPSPGAAFPAYFLSAVEAGGYTRGLALLALYPILRVLSHAARVKAMAMVSFCGLRHDEAARVDRAMEAAATPGASPYSRSQFSVITRYNL